MTNSSKKIVIYGGTFNPPHLAHAIAIETTMRLFPCDEIWVVPSAEREDKNIQVSGDDRLNMTRLMIDELFKDAKTPVIISELEIRRAPPTRTIDTYLELKKLHPDYEFHYYIGSDIVGDIETKWQEGKELFENMNFLIFERIQYPLPERLPPHAVIFNKDVVNFEISSTLLRNLFKKGHSGMPYVTKSVAEYIREHKLYQ